MGVRGRFTLVATLVTLLASLSVPAGAAAEQPETLRLDVPPLTGKFQVGTRSFPLVDRSRPAGFGLPGKRRLMVQVTYPRQPGTRPCRGSLYLPDGSADRLLSSLALRSPVEIDTRTCAGGPVLRRRMPLIVFSHAYTADRAVYTALVADLASRGYMVASIDHTSDAFAVEFPGGRVIDGAFGGPLDSKPVTEAQLVALVSIRVRDVRFVTNWLMRQNRARGTWLRHRIAPRLIGAFGHSLGGATAARVATVDRRFRASADIDGSMFGPWPLALRSGKPFMLLVAEQGLGAVLSRDKSCQFFDRASQPKLAWQLNGAMHLTFSDFQSLAPQIAERSPGWPFAALYPLIIGDLDPAASVRAQRAALARFFGTYLRPPRKWVRMGPPAPPAGVVPASADQLRCEAP